MPHICRCSKEREIAEMHTDIKYIRREIEGNGKMGLLKRVRSIEQFRYITTGGIIVLVTIIGWLIKVII